MSAEIELGTNVIVRNRMGQFIAGVNEAITRAVEESIVEGANAARFVAPFKTGALADSIQPVMTGPRSGVITVSTDHWAFQERGTAPHELPGGVLFWWEREGRPWLPGKNMIQHPGNPAVHFMRRGTDVANQVLQEELARLMP